VKCIKHGTCERVLWLPSSVCGCVTLNQAVMWECFVYKPARRRQSVVFADVPSTALREMRALQELRHPNVVAILGVYPQGPSLALVFECMACDLGELIRSTPRLLSEAEAKCIMKMVLQGVAYCHANAIVHRVCSVFLHYISFRRRLTAGACRI
jgi:serine/threonine protein kinase